MRSESITDFDLSVGGEPKPVASPTKVIGHAADKPEATLMAGDRIGASGVIKFVACLGNIRVLLLDSLKQDRRRHHFVLVPRIPFLIRRLRPGQ